MCNALMLLSCMAECGGVCVLPLRLAPLLVACAETVLSGCRLHNYFVLDCHVCWHHKLTGMPDCLCDGGTTLRVSLRDV